jgi:hypothetical protein
MPWIKRLRNSRATCGEPARPIPHSVAMPKSSYRNDPGGGAGRAAPDALLSRLHRNLPACHGQVAPAIRAFGWPISGAEAVGSTGIPPNSASCSIVFICCASALRDCTHDVIFASQAA